jgi:hypothetical protein
MQYERVAGSNKDACHQNTQSWSRVTESNLGFEPSSARGVLLLGQHHDLRGTRVNPGDRYPPQGLRNKAGEDMKNDKGLSMDRNESENTVVNTEEWPGWLT